MPLVAFAHEPVDAGSACIAVLASEEDPAAIVSRVRQLGAPAVFVVHRGQVQWWQQGERARHLQTFEPAELPRFFEEHRGDLAPEAVYRAKTRGRFEAGYQLSFVDVGLMPLVEEETGAKLADLVERALTEARGHLGSRRMTSSTANWLLQSVFWLLAAKILQDKGVSSFAKLDLTAIDEVLSRVAGHYSAKNPELGLRAKVRRDALRAAAEIFSRFASLAHVTPESLAAVYETSLVTKATRQKLGIHSTPPFLARYVVWRLAPWIEKIPEDERHVFEPTCGQGSFLIAAMRLLRDLLPQEMNRQKRAAYLRAHLHGVDVDSFAIELARLSLTLADVPNPDGWDLYCTNVFTKTDLAERVSRQGAIFLANPPFEKFKPAERDALEAQSHPVQAGSKTAELLRRSLPHLPPGGVFGVVVPRGLLHATGAADLRKTLVQEFEIDEITLLPDKVFSYSDAESALLLGRKIHGALKPKHDARYLQVRDTENDVERFRTSYEVSADRRLPQMRFEAAPGHSFAVPELEEVWEELQRLPGLQKIAVVAKGLEYLGKSKLPHQMITIADQRFPGAKPGFSQVGRDLEIHRQPREQWLSLNPAVINFPGSGTEIGTPQVLVNYARVSRDPWRLKAVLDPVGHAVTSSFLTVRPRSEGIPLIFLWALLNSPLANAFCHTHATSRHNLPKTLRALPTPKLAPETVRPVIRAAEMYLGAVKGNGSFGSPPPVAATFRDLLVAMDAEVMRLYDLPPRLERQVLDLFEGFRRPGVPFHFDRYFPVGFEPWIPLHLYLSAEYQRSTAGRLRQDESPVPESVVRALTAAVEAFED